MRGRSGNKQISNSSNNNNATFRWRATVLMPMFVMILFLVYFTAEKRLGHIIIEIKLDASSPMQSTCVSKNKTPKVALMFLAVERLHNEPVWRAFFEAAGRLCILHDPSVTNSEAIQRRNLKRSSSFERKGQRMLNLQSHFNGRELQRLECSDEKLMIEKEADRFLSSDWNVSDLIDRQTLFSVYVNSLAYSSIEEPSIFTGSVIEDPVDTHRGFAGFSPVMAAIRMMEVGLEDSSNQKFVLLSESCVPIQPPEVIHAQLISESQSRVSACEHNEKNLERWKPEIVPEAAWRKSSQFVAFTRKHAQLAVDDTELRHNFSQFCYTTLTMSKLCIPDEHFFATLIAYHGLDNETDCIGDVTMADWWYGSWHPTTYNPEDINPHLLRRLADGHSEFETCYVEQARATTAAIYGGFTSTGCTRRDVNPIPIFNPSAPSNATHWMLHRGYHQLTYSCPMLARKFPDYAVRETLEAALSCTATGLGYWCY